MKVSINQQTKIFVSKLHFYLTKVAKWLFTMEMAKKKTTVYDFSAATHRKAAHMPHFIAHYADVEHEILEVTSGYRVALTYSLCWQNNGNGTERQISNESIPERILRVFKKLSKRPYRIGVLLEHKYTSQSLETNRIRALKGRDNEWFNLLNEVSDRLGTDEKLSFHIASAELQVEYNLVGMA
jgi:hypothetical protein